MSMTIVYIICAVIAVLLAACGYIAFAEDYQDKVYEAVYQLVCYAERQITGTKKGQQRKEMVLEGIHSLLPRWAGLVITRQDLDYLVELAVAKMKQLLLTGGTLPLLPDEELEAAQ